MFESTTRHTHAHTAASSLVPSSPRAADEPASQRAAWPQCCRHPSGRSCCRARTWPGQRSPARTPARAEMWTAGLGDPTLMANSMSSLSPRLLTPSARATLVSSLGPSEQREPRARYRRMTDVDNDGAHGHQLPLKDRGAVLASDKEIGLFAFMLLRAIKLCDSCVLWRTSIAPRRAMYCSYSLLSSRISMAWLISWSMSGR